MFVRVPFAYRTTAAQAVRGASDPHRRWPTGGLRGSARVGVCCTATGGGGSQGSRLRRFHHSATLRLHSEKGLLPPCAPVRATHAQVPRIGRPKGLIQTQRIASPRCVVVVVLREVSESVSSNANAIIVVVVAVIIAANAVALGGAAIRRLELRLVNRLVNRLVKY